jgi:hypothetical protein
MQSNTNIAVANSCETQMKEQRQAPRQKSFLRGFVYFGSSPSAVDCLVRDMSDTGARLKFSGGFPAADIIDLHIPIKGQSFCAKVQWREADEIGIAFVSSAASGNADPQDGELSGRVARLEAEIAALKQMIKRLQKDYANTAAA